ncbi:MAG: ribonuclease J [Clostridiales bacterium GWE2_32_10]|nr:MAG: ribonuclease J [Clostridiales bacterium GWE2_32_10]HBY20545.1 ribonuclease J [Clostridiales bacterium]
MLVQTQKLKIIPLGGLEEVGKNMTVIEYDDEMVIIDSGLAFPEDDMLGIDLVIPDITYLINNKHKIKGLILTHGHEDHIGAVPYVLKQIDIPIYGTRLTLGLVDNKLKEHDLDKTVKKFNVESGKSIRFKNFTIEFIRTNHSIADSIALAIHTPVGIIVHSGDFKIDYTPIEGDKVIDLAKFAELGRRGVLAFMCDSTNAERKGYSMSETSLGKVFDEIFTQSTNSRIIVATFASNVHRIQQIINAANKFKRKVAISGRSMLNVMNTATELGYINLPQNIIIDVNEINKYADNQLVIITTGSQGEPMSALSRMANSEHRQIEIKAGDKVVLSSTPIPGNEKTVSKVINELYKKGAEVIKEDTHVSGHAYQEELKLLHTLLKPKYFIPVHGEYRHLKAHSELAKSLGMNSKNIFILNLGEVLELTSNFAKRAGVVQAGKVFVDGLGVGDVGNIVLRDRKHLSQDGLIVAVVTIDGKTGEIISGPDVISRGFVYVRESETLMDDVKALIHEVLDECQNLNVREWFYIKTSIKEKLREFLWKQTKRSPMILPIIMEV